MISIKKTQKLLDDLLLKSINETLRNTLGDNSKEIIHQHIMRNNTVEWNEIPQNIKIFFSNLYTLFGSKHFIIENLILENIYHKLGFVFEWKQDYTFLDYMKELHIKWRRSNI